ncbi:MAG TPA: ATP-binding protein, partial [Verrucomicrobiota bacterium]|nr:ATP-binding protein [Verrucomicrobiota bacterium]
SAVRRALDEARQRSYRESVEEKIREQAALLDKASDAIIVLDMSETVVFWNSGAERVYGWSSQEALSLNAEQLLATQEVDVLAEAKKFVIEHGEWMGQCYQRTKDGRRIMVASRWTLLRDAAGKPKARLIINTDITEFKRLEAQLLRAHPLESIGALAGGIAHDLNNILSPVLMATDLLAAKVEDEESKKILETVRGCTRRGAEMVKQVLSFARGVAGEAGVIQLCSVVRELTSLAKDTFPRSITIETSISQNLPSIVGNSTQIHQVLMNLCVNARDAMPEGGVLRLAVTTETFGPNASDPELPVAGQYVALTVADTGQGMTPEVLERIFDPFYTTKGDGKGTGLGLATVKDIVKNHDGFLTVSSEVGKGTTVKVLLPATKISETVEPSAPAALPTGNGDLILVVDDELAILEIVRGTLQSFNYRVLSARNGAEAVSLHQRHRGEIRAVLMDMMMPVMDGVTAVQTILKASPGIKIIGASGLESETVLKKATRVNTHAFLRKPYSVENLLITLNTVLSGKN